MLDVGCWMLTPGCWLLVPGSRMLDAGCWFLAPGCWIKKNLLKPGTRYQASGIKYQVSSIKHPVSSIQYQVSNFKFQASSIKYQVPRICRQLFTFFHCEWMGTNLIPHLLDRHLKHKKLRNIVLEMTGSQRFPVISKTGSSSNQ